MPDPKTETKAPVAVKPATATPELTPAGSATDPSVHKLLADLQTARANGNDDDAQDIVDYLATLGYSAG
jgi:hypothetical protein